MRVLALALAVVVTAIVARGGGTTAAPVPARLKVATYNIENYTLADRMSDGVFRRAHPKPEPEKAALREVLRRLDADVVVLQEVGGEPYLDELARDLASGGLVYPHRVCLAAADVDRRVGLLARHPPLQVVRHTDLTVPYFGERVPVKRGLLEVVFGTTAGPVTVFAVHLKSRFTDRADDPLSARRRAAEATALRNRILERCPDPEAQRFIIAGDFNDAPSGAAVRYFLTRGAMRIAVLTDAGDSRGERWTHHYAREDTYSRVDHLLLSPALRMHLVGTARIDDGPEVPVASDHRPVSLELVLAAPAGRISGP
jgi:endonuclease/exonuclease/phosphatase family metal-dependent hydrolase